MKSMSLEEASVTEIKSLSFTSVREAQASMAHRDFARAERLIHAQLDALRPEEPI